MEMVNKTYKFIIEAEIATEAEVDLVTGIYGYTMECLNDIIEFRTSYKNAEDCAESEYQYEDAYNKIFN